MPSKIIVLAIALAFMLASPPLSAISGENAYSGQPLTNEAESFQASGFGSVVRFTDVINVVVPLSLDFVIDPIELAGRGSVYSETYMIENHGDADVIITFSNIAITFANDTDFVPLSQPFGDRMGEPLKAIYMLLDFGRPEIGSVVATAESSNEPLSALLTAGGNELSFCSLTISGNLNPSPSKNWANGDVRISLTYGIEILTRPVSGGYDIGVEEE